MSNYEWTLLDVPKAPPISAPLVGMLTFTIPQSDPLGLERGQESTLKTKFQ